MARRPKRDKSTAPAPKSAPRPVIGWAEWVELPDLGVKLKAKVDTGARTSALHVVGILKIGDAPPLTPHGEPRSVVELKIPQGTRSRGTGFTTAEAVIEEFVNIKDSGGHAERRPVILTSMTLGHHTARIRVSLTDRGDMMYPMLLGRTALGARYHIDAGQRYRLTARKRKPAKRER